MKRNKEFFTLDLREIIMIFFIVFTSVGLVLLALYNRDILFPFANTSNEFSRQKDISNEDMSSNSSLANEDEEMEEDCNVVGINFHGGVVTYLGAESIFSPSDDVSSEWIVSTIKNAEEEESIKAIILEIDSPGGDPVSAEEIANALKYAKKPTVALIRGRGYSAAYWAATGADRIFASRNSDIGSIGVTMSYTKDLDENLKFVQLSTGKYKDLGNPDKPLTEDDRKVLMDSLYILKDNFVKAVAENRNIPVKKVESLADGNTFLGEKALALGLIDEIGSWKEVDTYLEKELGVKPEICWKSE